MKLSRKKQGLVALLVVLTALLLFAAPALAADTGWLSPGGHYGDFGVNLPQNADNAYSQDDSAAVFSSAWQQGFYPWDGYWKICAAHYTFGADLVPDDATITGIKVEVDCYHGNWLDPNLIVELWQSSQKRGSGKNATASWPVDADTYFTLGSASSTWGYDGWTADKINDHFNLRVISSNDSGKVNLDHIQVKIYYTVPEPPANTAPLAMDDSYSVDEDGTLSVDASGTPAGVLGNDSDADDDALTAVLVDDAENGDLELNADGSFTYTPDENFHGSDSFTYKANDGTVDSNTATVAITVNSVNDAPVLAYIDKQRVKEGKTCQFQVSASDVDSDVLTFSLAGAPKGAKIDAVSGLFTWKTGDSDTYTFTVRVGDNESPPLYDEQKVTVSVFEDVDYEFKIKATAGSGGDIDPKGDTWLYRGEDITFTVKPDKGYEVDDVLVDGQSVGAVKKYTFKNVRANHTIKAVFSRICNCERFIDIDTSLWYHDGIDYVVGKGLFQGVSANRFSPYQPMTRAMLVTVLYRLDDTTNTYGGNPFVDVENNSWYSGAVIWAVGRGIITGYDAQHFGPNDPLTREQLVAILYRYAIQKGYAMSGGDDPGISLYSDAGSISDYAVPAMEWACKKGIIEGNSLGMINPLGLAARAEVATIIMRFMQVIN